MDTSPALLLLLALGFCCPGIYGQSLEIKVVSPKDISQLQLGQRLELECRTDRNSGAFWIHKDKKGTLHFIVFISSTAKTTFGNQIKATRFQASKHNAIYYLAVKSFTPQDEGNYFCVMNYNQMLYFSPGQTAFLPAQTGPKSIIKLRGLKLCEDDVRKNSHAQAGENYFIVFLYMLNSSISLIAIAVVAPGPTTPGPVTQWNITEMDSCLKTPDPSSRMQENLEHFCLTFLWIPLAGLCLLLLQLLATTIVLRRHMVHHDPL
ncbi:hypothetical protein Nmel_007461 [Mimus melanotis]